MPRRKKETEFYERIGQPRKSMEPFARTHTSDGEPVPLARDAFAAAALQGLLARGWRPSMESEDPWNRRILQFLLDRLRLAYAVEAYKLADAMLEARKK